MSNKNIKTIVTGNDRPAHFFSKCAWQNITVIDRYF
jgi:hypothetical protein